MASFKLPKGLRRVEVHPPVADLIREAMYQGLAGEVALERALALYPHASAATKRKWAVIAMGAAK